MPGGSEGLLQGACHNRGNYPYERESSFITQEIFTVKKLERPFISNKIAFFIPIFICFIMAGMITGCLDEKEPVCDEPPCEPEAAVHTMEIADGFEVEVFVSEPLIRDPVAMEVDEQGRIYVAEDPGYPEDRGNNGVVRLLEDTDGDGRPDDSTVFADSLRAPRGVMRWKEGILVTDAPEILYFEDTDGDGRADRKEVVMSGFNYGNPQLGVNTPIYGLDNWIYVAHMQGSSTPYFKNAEGRQDKEIARRANIRFRPETRQWEATAAASQFGHSFDAYGRPLYVTNNNHIIQEVIDVRYLKENPDLLAFSASTSISDHGTSSEVFPITEITRYELFSDLGAFTAACGLTCYLGGRFPSEYRGAAFVPEPAHNLVHADRLEEDGITLKASRIHEGREFLASTDRWFRPVNTYVGPDGALYIVDYYREVIEQPRYLSQEVLESGMLYDGTDRGRIYRVSREGSDAESWMENLNLSGAPTKELVERLAHENIWWRRTAQRLLVDRADKAAVDPLENLAATSPSPVVRSQALWTLEGMGALSASRIESALQDPSPRVREQAIRLADLHLDSAPGLARSLLGLGKDSDTRVRFQLLCTLGKLNSEESRNLRQQLFSDHLENEWMQLAYLSAGNLSYRSLFEEAMNRLAQKETEGRSTYFERLGMLMGARREKQEIAFLVSSITTRSDEQNLWWQSASLDGLADGLARGEDPGELLQSLREPVAGLTLHPDSAPLRNAAREVMTLIGVPTGSRGDRIFRLAEKTAADPEADALLRADAIGLLDLDGAAEYESLLKDLIDPHQPGPVQAAAARALADIGGRNIGEMLLSQWAQMTPQVRTAAMKTMLADDARAEMVLDAVERGEIRRSQINSSQTNRLMLHSDEEIRRRARSLLGISNEPRSEVIERYMAATRMEGDPEQGREVYERACAMCHQIGGEDGVAVGPDLESVRNNRPQQLIDNILIPNREIAAGYEQWRVELKDGETLQGTLVSETPGSITFRDATGRETTVSRDEIRTMESTNRSAMPEGLERQISVEEMADLIQFLKTTE